MVPQRFDFKTKLSFRPYVGRKAAAMQMGEEGVGLRADFLIQLAGYEICLSKKRLRLTYAIQNKMIPKFTNFVSCGGKLS